MNKREARRAAYRRASTLLEAYLANGHGEIGCPTCLDTDNDCKDCHRMRAEMDAIIQMLFDRGSKEDTP